MVVAVVPTTADNAVAQALDALNAVMGQHPPLVDVGDFVTLTYQRSQGESV